VPPLEDVGEVLVRVAQDGAASGGRSTDLVEEPKGAYESGDCAPPKERFRRGDSNADGATDISGPVSTLGYLFLGAEGPPCLDAADAEDSGALDITDAIYDLGFLFLGGPPPAAPFAACSIDGSLDGLDCAVFAPCGGR
jgi:hypothetical protein